MTPGASGKELRNMHVSAIVNRVLRRSMDIRASSMDMPSAATRPSVPSIMFCLDRSQGPHSHSFSSTVTTSLEMGGS